MLRRSFRRGLGACDAGAPPVDRASVIPFRAGDCQAVPKVFIGERPFRPWLWEDQAPLGGVFENSGAGVVDFAVAVLGLRVSRFDFFWPLAMVVHPLACRLAKSTTAARLRSDKSARGHGIRSGDNNAAPLAYRANTPTP